MEHKYIHLDDSILHQEWFKHSPTVQVFLYLLFHAGDDEHEEQGQTLHRGQIIVSRNKLAKDLGLTEMQVRTALSKLSKGWLVTNEKHWITTKLATNKQTLITICDYDSYKGVTLVDNQVSNQPVASVAIQPNKPQDTDSYTVCIEEQTGTLATNKTMPPYQMIGEYFNRAVAKSNIPKIRSLSDARRKAIRSRLKEYNLDTILSVIDKAVASDFLNGAGNTGFTASFDWIMKPSNFIKIIEGNYDNREERMQDRIRGDANLYAAVEAISRIDNEERVYRNSKITDADSCDTDVW